MHVAEGETVAIGQVVGEIATETARVPVAAKEVPPSHSPSPSTAIASSVELHASPPREPSTEHGPLPLAPSIRRLVKEHGIDPSQIEGSGKHGRLTKADVLDYVANRQHAAQPEPPTPSAPSTPPVPSRSHAPAMPPAPHDTPSHEPLRETPRQTRQKMSSLRRRIADRMVEAQKQAAILSTFNEADMSHILALRERYKKSFEERYRVKLGMMSFFVKATVDALQTVPALNAQIDGDEIVQHHFYDIGVAVGTPRGLVAPVIRNADRLNFAEIEQAISDAALRARDGKLQLSELTGGCFTISNGGIYGSLLSTPILNPPQSGILGMHSIKKRPIVIDDQLVIRPMMYLALSYDHRIVDGQQAVTFLKRIVDCLENPERLLLAI